ncbi:hypothetical protein Taro_020915, partial [Colocasia esculenta]|nr:hypothetical protein [Colocasia esculenta]
LGGSSSRDGGKPLCSGGTASRGGPLRRRVPRGGVPAAAAGETGGCRWRDQQEKSPAPAAFAERSGGSGSGSGSRRWRHRRLEKKGTAASLGEGRSGCGGQSRQQQPKETAAVSWPSSSSTSGSGQRNGSYAFQWYVTYAEMDMIENVLEIKDTHVREVMTPLVDVVAIDAGAKLIDFQKLWVTHQYSRVPVFEERVDNIVGIAYAMDMLEFVEKVEQLQESTVGDIAHKPTYFVPDSMSVWNLLREFRIRKVHMAVVLNEYGGTVGVCF